MKKEMWQNWVRGVVCAVCVLCVAGGLWAVEAEATDVFPLYELERVWPQYSQLRLKLMQAIREGDTAGMEKIARAGVALMPGDATWQYNLACALAYRAKPDLALEALSRAVQLGFRDVATIKGDNDLKRIAGDPRFARILADAEAHASEPPPGMPTPLTLQLTPGTKRIIEDAHLFWNYDIGFYVVRLNFQNGLQESPGARAAAYRGPAGDLMRTWLADGTAVGNAGDIYVNRDNNHSPLRRSDFPLLSELKFNGTARKRNIDRALPNTLYPGAAIIGNASLAIVSTNDSCSLPRVAMLDSWASIRLGMAATENQFWIFPANRDYDPDAGVDRFPGASAACLTTLGASRSDQPFLRAAAAASAAFTPQTKQAILKQHLFAPTLQWLFRRTQQRVKCDADYLTGKAHPTAFDEEELDVNALVTMAHALTPETLPPAALPYSRIVTILPTDLEKHETFRVAPLPQHAAVKEWTWRVVHGEAARVKIVAQGAQAEITVDCRKLKDRIDVAVFARTEKSAWGAPAFISFTPLEFGKLKTQSTKAEVKAP